MNGKIGLKLWSSNRNYFEEAQRLCADGWCDYIELYAVPDTLNEFGAMWKTLDIPYIIHAPHFRSGMNLATKENADKNRMLAEQAFAFADLLNADKVIFHPGVMGKEAETIRQLNTFPNEWKAKILIENKPYQAIDNEQVICNGHSPELIRQIVNETGVGFCFDIGHCICSANSRNVNLFQDIAAFEALNPAMYHLSDNDFTSPIDGHKHFGFGNYPFAEIFELIDTPRPVSIETDKKYTDSLKDFEDDVRFLKKGLYEFSIAPAALKDMREVYELANEPRVRANSISTDPIPWETHQVWYQKKIVDPDFKFYLVRNRKQELCGYVRYAFEEEQQRWFAGTVVSSQCGGRGLGTWAMKMTEVLLRQTSELPIEAQIKTTNAASIKMFQNAGYVYTGQKEINGNIFNIYHLG